MVKFIILDINILNIILDIERGSDIGGIYIKQLLDILKIST